ncbi:hypothetical protein BDZ85DRAFT_285058 [Elsinoe ampelina]|uniref:C2H2-type domain-containing protein n=1 Tax=Elsinoe ampelina TaxID=302913 RepID=A0A6A6G277_9PEZI|nr:hypothetical protein BDZ85DRAFT_285058 [Elsinoe ampelina]
MDNQFQSSSFNQMGSQHQPQHQQPQQQQQQQQQPFAGFPGQHQQPPAAHENSTLPPLQPAAHNYSHLPPLHTGGVQHSASPHTPHTPALNSAASHTPSNFSTMSTPVTAGSMPPPSTSYMAPSSGYSTSQPSPVATHHQGAQPPANRLQDIRPMPPGGGSFNSPISPFPAFNNATAMAQQGQHQYIPSQESEPTHVVGSQGRRGILPSVPGRAPAPTSINTVSAKSLIPTKDADGKFPCPHCNKTYLHAKHLKRHLLRHTGDRPYMCHLCKDTFSRSDILKRHFQKCSIRRGNPTGANHLAGQRRNTGGSTNPRLSLGQADQPMGLAGMSDVGTPTGYQNGGSMPNTVTGSPTVNGEQSSYASSIASMSNRSSRANSLIQPPGAFGGVPTLPSSGQNGEHHPVTSAGFAGGIPAYAMRPHSASNPIHPSAYGYGPPPTSNGGMYGAVKAEDHSGNNYTAHSGPVQQQQGRPNGNMEWNHVFNTNGQDGFMPQGQQDQSHIPKSEHSMEGQSFDSAGPYQNNFLNGIQHQTGAYAENGAHANGMALASR